MKSIIEDIKNKDFKRVYLLYGEETYLKIQFRDKLCHALNQEDTMNYSEFEGKGQNEGQIIDLAETMPFFSDHRLILLQDTGFFKNKADRMADYMAELPDYICMIFVESEVDKRSRMYKAVRKYGRTVEFVSQDEKTLARWVLGTLKRENKKITKSDLDLFFTVTGTDMGNIERELEKLICYTMGRDVITDKDIKTICTAQITNQIFDMVRAVTAKQQKKALDLYYDLLSLKESPMKILALIAREFHMMLQVKGLQLEGSDIHTIAERTGLRDFVVRKYLPMTRSYSMEQLRAAMDDCITTETDVKTGRLSDAMSVELLIIRFSSKKSY
ncbi:DNA polymerase III subunit delta [Blautia liquoris]|uniref:DNA polymerase III subunit delta n=1 Tax=Blautia liquoris TaxID=2779518 RepID=A0A7M2RI98_9FIRM|nr:DNA polymerase III subunit delta [Blautia liquoris]QOV20063.1 DNA polymerase III subunit delta [Blautia liquoris]